MESHINAMVSPHLSRAALGLSFLVALSACAPAASPPPAAPHAGAEPASTTAAPAAKLSAAATSTKPASAAASNGAATSNGAASSTEPNAAAPSNAAGTSTSSIDGIRSERIAIRFADPNDVARMLRELFELRRPSARRDVRAVMVDSATGDLVVVANAKGIARIRQMLAPGLTPIPEAERLELLAFEHADAKTVAHTLHRFVPPRAHIVADEPTNTLVIGGPPKDRAKLLALARALDRPTAQ